MSLSSRALLGASAAVAVALALLACTDTFPSQLDAYDADTGDAAPPLEDSGPLPIPEAGDAGNEAGDAGDATVGDGGDAAKPDGGDAGSQDGGDAGDADVDSD